MEADGMGKEEILKAYPDLCSENVREGLKYAAEAVRRARTAAHSSTMKFLVMARCFRLFPGGKRPPSTDVSPIEYHPSR
ncbi:MAG: DUF433 domain-containing protein [Nitrospirales bacterium]